MQKSCHVAVISDKNPIWMVPADLFQSLKLLNTNEAILHFGSKSIRVTVKQKPAKGPLATKKNRMFLSSKVFQTLHIPPNITVRVKPEKTGEYRLGPLIGVLTFPAHLPHKLGYYRNSANINKNNGLVFIFKGRDINPVRETIWGYYYDHVGKGWKSMDFPYPDTVIDRCYPNDYVAHRHLEKVLGLNKIFNKKSMITKLDFAKTLAANNYLRHYIAETKPFTKSSDLTEFLEKYQEVFLKPVNAMMGFGIVFVEGTPDGPLKCNYTINKKPYTKTIFSPDTEIFELLVTAAGRRRPYIIQQGLQRMEYKGGPISIRSWAMKNGSGRWIIPGMFVKGSFGKGFLTNFTAGAKLIPLQEFYANIAPRLPYTREELSTLISNLTLRTAKALDRDYGPLGELGLDIVFDTAGKPYIIEANGNPGTAPIYIQKDYPLWPALLTKLPLEYATYLAGFKNKY